VDQINLNYNHSDKIWNGAPAIKKEARANMSHRLLAEYIPRGNTFPQGRYGDQSTPKQVHDTAHKKEYYQQS
jgi:hypothetical protein